MHTLQLVDPLFQRYVSLTLGIVRAYLENHGYHFARRPKPAFHGIHQPRISRSTDPVLPARVKGVSTRCEASFDYLPLNIPLQFMVAIGS